MKKTIDLQKIIELTEQKKTPEEIGVLLGVSSNTIRRRLREMNISPYSKVTKLTPELLDTINTMVDEGKTNRQISEKLLIPITTVKRYITQNLKKDFNRERAKTTTKQNITLTKEQWEVLYGSLLGDMSIDSNWKNARPIISQGGEQEEYFDYKCSIFSNLIGKPNKQDRFDKRTNKWYHKYIVKFLTNPIYTKLKEELYPNGIKTVTQEWLNKITPRGLAFWFMDDGSNCGTIATNSFSHSECELIVKWFKDKWDINCTIQKSFNNNHEQYLTYIKKDSRKKFYDLVFPYFIPSMLYKLENWNL